MGQGAARLSTSNAERDEEGANQNPHLLSEEDEVSASHASISSNHPPAQELQEVAVDIPEPPAPPPLEPVEVEPPRAPDVYFGAAFLPEGFVPAPQDALLLGARPELAALVSNGILGRLPQIPAVQSAPSAQSLVHIHRESILLEPVPDQQDKYILSFRIDALEDCIVHAYWRATENNNGTQATFISQQQSPEWPAMRFPEGRDQLVRYEQHLDLSNVPDEVLQWESAQAGPPPISFVISTATPGPATVVDTEILTARLLKGASGGFTVRPIRVRVRYRGKFYVVYEIFGAADNVPATPTPATTGGTVETLPLLTPTGGRECVICITDPRDTIVLPCRHMCLCVPCAEALRTQTNKCPLCRTPVKGLLKVGALPAPYTSSPSPSSSSPHPPTKSSSKNSDGEVEELQLLHRERHSTSADV